MLFFLLFSAILLSVKSSGFPQRPFLRQKADHLRAAVNPRIIPKFGKSILDILTSLKYIGTIASDDIIEQHVACA